MKEKELILCDGKMSYYLGGSGKPIIFLHGWGQRFATFNNIVNKFKSNYQILGLDLLGFGNSSYPHHPLSIDVYTNHLEILVKKLAIHHPIIIAHSFGGRIAMHYASKNPVAALILVSSAGIKKRNLYYYYKIYKYKILKQIYRWFSKVKYERLITSSGSTDYQNSNMVMKQTLSKVVNYNSQKDMKKINCQTYLCWGIYDDVTPYRDGLKINNLIKDCEMIQFYKSGHFCYLQEEQKFVRTVETIIRKVEIEGLYGSI